MNPIKTIAVGFDGSTNSRAAVAWASSLSAALGAHLKVVHAVGLLEHAGQSRCMGGDWEEARNVARQSGMNDSHLEWLAVDGDPVSALLRMTEAPHSVDLLVVGSRGAGQHSGTLLGSTSLELVEHSSVAVAVIPAAGVWDGSTPAN
jgi:nucleotide-binding universal stress UspA family protein